MIQCFAKPDFKTIFDGGNIPRLVSASKVDADRGAHPRILHKHDDQLEILLIRRGGGVYIVDGRRCQVKAGDLVILGGGALHDEDPSKSLNADTYCCAFAGVKLVGGKENQLLPKDAHPALETGEAFETFDNIMGAIYALLASDAKAAGETCAHLGAALVALAARTLKNNMERRADESIAPADLVAERVKQFVDERYAEPLSLESIAAALRMNPYYLCRMFKRGAGYSPMQYILRRRIGEAQSLLIGTNYSVTRIAGLTGFGNPSHFTIQFLKYVGMPPSKYRVFYTKIKS